MLVILIVLTAVSAVCMITGFVWMLTAMGKTTSEHGQAVGEEMVAEHLAEAEESMTGKSAVFRGRAVAKRSEASISFRDIWRLVEERQWHKVIPVLLLLGGLLGLLLFGALTLFLSMENRLLGGFFVAMALYVLVRTMLSFVKA